MEASGSVEPVAHLQMSEEIIDPDDPCLLFVDNYADLLGDLFNAVQ